MEHSRKTLQFKNNVSSETCFEESLQILQWPKKIHQVSKSLFLPMAAIVMTAYVRKHRHKDGGCQLPRGLLGQKTLHLATTFLEQQALEGREWTGKCREVVWKYQRAPESAEVRLKEGAPEVWRNNKCLQATSLEPVSIWLCLSRLCSSSVGLLLHAKLHCFIWALQR